MKKNRAWAGWGCHFQMRLASVRRRAALAARLASVRHILPNACPLCFMRSVYLDKPEEGERTQRSCIAPRQTFGPGRGGTGASRRRTEARLPVIVVLSVVALPSAVREPCLPLPGPHEAAWLFRRRKACGGGQRREDTPAYLASQGIRVCRTRGEPLLKVAPFSWRLRASALLRIEKIRFLIRSNRNDTRAEAKKKPDFARRRLRSLRFGTVGRRREYQQGRFACSQELSRRSNQKNGSNADVSTDVFIASPMLVVPCRC